MTISPQAYIIGLALVSLIPALTAGIMIAGAFAKAILGRGGDQ